MKVMWGAHGLLCGRCGVGVGGGCGGVHSFILFKYGRVRTMAKDDRGQI